MLFPNRPNQFIAFDESFKRSSQFAARRKKKIYGFFAFRIGRVSILSISIQRGSFGWSNILVVADLSINECVCACVCVVLRHIE